MGIGIRRVAIHATLAMLLASSAVLATSSSGHADSTARPTIFGGEATASSLHFFMDRTPAFSPFADLFHVEVPYSTSSFDSSGTDSSSASLIYPGGALLGAAGTICGQFVPPPGCPFSVPNYPLIANANYPTQPDDSAEASLGTQSLGGLLTASPNLITAHADNNGVMSQTAINNAAFADVATAGASTTSSQQAFKNGALIVEAQSAVHDFTLLSILLHIEEIHSTAIATVDGSSVNTADANTVLTGVTFAGHPATIDDKGIHVDTGGDSGAVAAGINSALANMKSQGISVRMTGKTRSLKRGNVSASTGGLLIAFENKLPDLPLPPLPKKVPIEPPNIGGDYYGSISVAGAGVIANASGYSFTPPAGGSGLGLTPSGPTGGVIPDVSLGSGQPTSETLGIGSSTPTTLTSPALAGTPALATGQHADTTSVKLKTVALVLAGYPLLVLLGGLLRAPARFPRRT